MGLQTQRKLKPRPKGGIRVSIEMIGVVTLDGSVSVFHAMRLTEKMARELDLM